SHLRYGEDDPAKRTIPNRNSPLGPLLLAPRGCVGTGPCTRVASRSRRFHAPPLQRLPAHIASHILPQALQPPEHVHLPVRKMLQKAAADQPSDILPVIVPFVGQLFLKHRADGNDRGKSVAEK